ncbi:hypothetical protein SAMN05443252_105116 [Bacillus sp. OV322]|uniref:hypothetical protein n=1 Tax=Bacillus sp. OV322 TaxID=1882764 RepID=UPI0008F3C422|nr:hypothetical protein [Bacillus sp. OV322]SFC65924.1 hypothetical protein SAMN05443252_105116 [Bacillus sp. OV322]
MNDHFQFLYVFLIVGFFLYRRIRRSIGFQPYKARRLIARTLIFSLLAILLIASCVNHPISFVYTLIGIALGGILLFYGIRHSTFELRSGIIYYRTSIWVESLVLLLFLSRFIFRFLILIQMMGQQKNSLNSTQYSQHFMKDPLTIAVFFILVVYYIGFYLFVYKKGKIKNQENKTTLIS